MRLMALVIVASLTMACQEADSGDDYERGLKAGCEAAGNTWDAATGECLTSVDWLMVQDAEGVSFVFDDAVDPGCSEASYWSGTMTMTGVGPETLWFSDRPNHLAFNQPTADFVDGFAGAFTAESGGDPNAVLDWVDLDTGADSHAIIILRAIDGSSPSYDADQNTLTYAVCGVALDDPATLEPLPEAELERPLANPNAAGHFALFIDSDRGQRGGLQDFICGGFTKDIWPGQGWCTTWSYCMSIEDLPMCR